MSEFFFPFPQTWDVFFSVVISLLLMLEDCISPSISCWVISTPLVDLVRWDTVK